LAVLAFALPWALPWLYVLFFWCALLLAFWGLHKQLLTIAIQDVAFTHTKKLT
jgi:hypothetical protein